MDLELFPLLVGIAIGGLLGRKGKDIVKPIAKGAMTLQERAREWGANLREDMHDAIEEARYERDQESSMHEASAAQPSPAPAPSRRRRSAAAASEAAEEKPKRARRARAAAPTGTNTRRRRTARAGEAGASNAPAG